MEIYALRHHGIQTLQKFVDAAAAANFEYLAYQCIFSDHSISSSSLAAFEKLYKDYLYETICLVKRYDNDIDRVYSILCNKKIGRDNVLFHKFKLQQQQLDDLQEAPIEIEEGVAECFKCGNKKILSYQKQTRRADESSTTFNTCIKCGNKWNYSG